MLTEGYRSNPEYRGNGRVEWMVCHCDRQDLHQNLLPTITDSLSQSDEDFYHHLHQKNLDVLFWQTFQYLKFCSLPVLY